MSNVILRQELPKPLEFRRGCFNVVSENGNPSNLVIACSNPAQSDSTDSKHVLYLGDGHPAHSSLVYLNSAYKVVKHIPYNKMQFVEG
jgi:hypothetical protein